MSSRIEKIKEFIEKCDLLENGKVHVDYIKDDPQSYSIEESPAVTTLKKFVDGAENRQILFDFSIQANFSVLENIKNSQFCDDFINWIEKQNRTGNLPNIEGAISIECTGRGTIIRTTKTTAIYVIPIKFVYYQAVV